MWKQFDNATNRKSNITLHWTLVFYHPLWWKVSSLFQLWPHSASLKGVVGCSQSVQLYITAARQIVRPVEVSKNNIVLHDSLMGKNRQSRNEGISVLRKHLAVFNGSKPKTVGVGIVVAGTPAVTLNEWSTAEFLQAGTRRGQSLAWTLSTSTGVLHKHTQWK